MWVPLQHTQVKSTSTQQLPGHEETDKLAEPLRSFRGVVLSGRTHPHGISNVRGQVPHALICSPSRHSYDADNEFTTSIQVMQEMSLFI